MMQNVLALLVVTGAIMMLVLLGGDLGMFADFYGVLFLVLFTYSSTVIAFGTHGFIKSITGLSYLFANDIAHTPASDFLSVIFKRQVVFIYGAAFIAFLIGSIAIFSSDDAINSQSVFYSAFAVNLLIVMYAAILAEGVYRPLATKLETRKIAQQFKQTEQN